MLLYIIRHGEPNYETDSLTQRGRQQAAAVAKRLYDSKTTDDMMSILDEVNCSLKVSNSIASAIAERCMQRFELDLNVILVDMEGNYLNDNHR